MKFKSIIAASLFALSISISAPQFSYAQDLSEAVEAYQADDYSVAVPSFQALANQGDTDSMWYLGEMYDNGWGVEQSDELAFKWWKKAADLGDLDSQWEIGLMYDIGQWVSEDQNVAFDWYMKSAENGRFSAMNEIGTRYSEGIGVKKSEKKAVKWYKQAAEGGHAEGQANYGLQHEFGNGGLKESAKKALYWYQLSAEQGDASGQAYLGEMYESGTVVEENLAEARRLYKLAAAQDNDFAKERLADMDSSRTSSASANASSSSSIASSGQMSAEEALDDAIDAIDAFSASLEPANFKSAETLFNRKEFEAAYPMFYKMATENNHARSQAYIGWMNGYGKGTTQSWEEGVKWTRKAAEAHDAEAQHDLGVYYFNGNPFLPVDKNIALEWFRKAARNHYEPSRELLRKYNLTW